jgi:taurine transport system ATP-binding protein
MIRLESVNLRYEIHGTSQQVLKDISLDLHDGSLYVVIGESGCGKTSLLNLIAGFISPSSGTLKIDGHIITAPGKDRAVVFQDDALLPWQTVLENVAFGLLLAGRSRAQREARAREYLNLTGLQQYADYPIWKISGGMRQRVGLARALAADPRFLLLDEPLGALDALTRARMQEHLLQVWSASGKGMLMITHSVDEALLLATDLISLRAKPGRIASIRKLNFGRRLIEGEPVRSIKTSREFVELREYVTEELLQAGESIR